MAVDTVIETDDKQQIDIGADEKAVTVTVEPESASPVVVSEEKPAEKRKKADASSDELGEYSDSVKKRIDKLTSRLRETERREQAAVEYARGVQRQAVALQTQLHHTDNGRRSEAHTRSETQGMALRQIIKKAREEGDIDTETEAHERLTGLMMEQRQLQQEAQFREQQMQQAQAAQQQANQQQVQQQARPRPDPRAESWAERNPWFGADTVMTHAVWGIHRQLLEQEGFDATSDEYYDELDRRISDLFPNRGKRESQQVEIRTQRPVQAVAPATRSSGVNVARRAVRLSPSQVAIAKKLGVPLEEYAKYVKE